MDAFHALAGERMSSKLNLDPIQSAVLGSLAQCSPQRLLEAVQHRALLPLACRPSHPPAGHCLSERRPSPL